ncbi:MAG: hypothetical protein H0Z32_12600 [Bacillaceae bacterium]|nr:hypothetical protein [Bacillaceae bacterium]
MMQERKNLLILAYVQQGLKWKGMLILNLKHGFDVIGTYTDEKGEPKIILRKNLLELNSQYAP